jgi:hypothetical protein
MLIAYFVFDGQITWRLSTEDSPAFPIPGTTEWLLVNPLLYPQLPSPRHDHISITSVAPGRYYCMYPADIILVSVENRSLQPSVEESPDIAPIAEDLLVRLRHISGQARMPGSGALMLSGYREIAELPKFLVASDDRFLGVRGRFSRHSWETAITAETIKVAAALGPDFFPPTYEALFLDAVAGCHGKDHRMAILYSTIAAEVALGSVIGESYERLLSAKDDDRFRVIELSQAGGSKVRKDPIYEVLRRHPDFGALLHELSLYVLRRSLLVENEALYADAKRLYSTRNQLVHSGELSEGSPSSPYPIDSKGALAAVKTVAGIFVWLGLRGDFAIPGQDFLDYPSQTKW